MRAQKGTAEATFKTTDIANVPRGRKGKHHVIVAAILADLERLEPGHALKIPIGELTDTTVNIRPPCVSACAPTQSCSHASSQ